MGGVEEPFPGSWAVAAGVVTRWRLQKDYVRVFPDVYVRKGVELDARGRAMAAGHWAKGSATLVGFSAAAMHGVEWFGDREAELNRGSFTRTPEGIRCRGYQLDADELVTVGGFSVTSPERTAFDLGRRRELTFEEAVAAVDAVCSLTGTTLDAVRDVARRHGGAAGSKPLRRVLAAADAGAESPRETVLRLFLVENGFPRPETQVRVKGPDGLVFRLDMGGRNSGSRWSMTDGSTGWTRRSGRGTSIGGRCWRRRGGR
jgi:hypothetical protein